MPPLWWFSDLRIALSSEGRGFAFCPDYPQDWNYKQGDLLIAIPPASEDRSEKQKFASCLSREGTLKSLVFRGQR
jgi:hypothetical protein